MSTDLQILLQKFNNFKVYIKSVSTNEKVLQDYENMTDNEFLLFGLGFLIPNKNKIELVNNQLCSKLNICDNGHKEKIGRYINCFIEYLEQLNDPDILKNTVLSLAQEKGIPQ
jgi:hypothetical protein